MKTADDQTMEALALANAGQDPGIQPSILANFNIDPTKITECTSCYVNDSWAPQLTELLKSGYIIFRIQTEFQINGHVTVAYLAKLKA